MMVFVTSKQYNMIFIFIFQLHMTSFMLLLLPKLLQLQKKQTLVNYRNIISEACPLVGWCWEVYCFHVCDFRSLCHTALSVALCVSFSNLYSWEQAQHRLKPKLQLSHRVWTLQYIKWVCWGRIQILQNFKTITVKQDMILFSDNVVSFSLSFILQCSYNFCCGFFFLCVFLK